MEPLRLGLVLAVSAFAAFLAANLIHNRFTVDAAVVPSALFIGLFLWKRWRALLVVEAVCIAAPALGFFKPAAILEPTGALRMANHVFLLVAGLLAVAAGIAGLVPGRRRARA